jgi:hypothetical protein
MLSVILPIHAQHIEEADLFKWWRSAGYAERLTVLATGVAVLGLIPGYIAFRNAPESSSDALTEIARAAAREQRALRARIEVNTREVQRLRSELNSLNKPPSQGAMAAQVGNLTSRMDQMDEDLSALENAILRDPAKALEIPLLERDLENNQLANQAALAAVRQDIDRQYDLMKWILGTFAVGIAGLIFTGLASVRRESKERDKS